MTSQVFYRKWRPQRFRELAGQEHVSTTLCHAVDQGRVAHSYLFCGPRGTGKTSTARVMAKAINCLSTQAGDPCNECSRCQAINDGRFMDLIELDAASNRGIDEIRNIRDKVNLAPVEGGRKVYIIDEAHMLTEHASNAFLKTLEEPPPHAVFVLCTTEPHKILPTIISRCQRFDFRRLTSEAISERLRIICTEEGVDADGEALAALSHAAGGSLRDAENLLEQLVVYYGGRAGKDEVHEMLGLGQGTRALDLTRYILMGNVSSALSDINRAAWDGADLRQLHRQTIDLIRGVLMLQWGSRDSLDMPQEVIQELEDLAPRTSRARVMKALKLMGEINMRYDSASTLPMELAVVEACMEEATGQGPSFPPDVSAPRPAPPSPRPAADRAAPRESDGPAGSGPSPASNSRGGGNGTRREAQQPAPPPREARPANTQAGAQDNMRPPSSSQPARPAPEREAYVPDSASNFGPGDPSGALQDQWGGLVRALSRYKGNRFNIGALLRDCKGQHIEGDTLVLDFAHRSHMERMQEELDDPQGMRTINEAIKKSLGNSYELKLKVIGDNGASRVPVTSQSPLVRAALNMGARIMEEREQ